MSVIEAAVNRVRKLSPREARELLGWLDKQQTKGTTVQRRGRQPLWRVPTLRQRKKRFKAWLNSVRGTTDWEPPRMSDELVDVSKFRL
jgi:hypothetical protein